MLYLLKIQLLEQHFSSILTVENCLDVEVSKILDP